MAQGRQRPSWMVPAVVGVCIVLFVAIAFIFGLGGMPRTGASRARAVGVPGSAVFPELPEAVASGLRTSPIGQRP